MAGSTRRFARRQRSRRLRRRLRQILVSVGLLLAFAAGVWLVAFSSVLEVRTVQVRGLSVLSEADVLAAAGVPPGEPLVRVDLSAVQAGVLDLAAVKEVEVDRSWPHTVVVVVTERTPVAVLDRGGAHQLVDAEGVTYHQVTVPPADLPRLSLPYGDTEVVRAAAAVAAALPPEIAEQVETVQAGTPDSVTLRLTSGVRVTWGSAEESVRKGKVLLALMAQDGAEEVTRYDVSVPTRPAAS